MHSCLLWIGLAFVNSSPAAVTVTDDRDYPLTLAQPAQRIISLAPHLTELLYAAGAGDRIIATVEFSDYPLPAQALPRVGDAHNLDSERILFLQPDLLVAWGSGNPRNQVEQLLRLGLPVYVSEPGSLATLPDTLIDLGRLAGTEATATVAADDFRARLQALRERHANRSPVSVFYQVWHRPLISVGNRHLIHEVIELCGGRNILAGVNQLAPRVEVEAVLQADPQVIIGGGSDQQRERQDWRQRWQDWPRLRAVRDEQLYFIHADLLQRHSPRLLEGAEQMCKYLQQARTQAGR